MQTKLQVSNCHRNIMGTVSFMGRFPGMRKEQDFIVYPMRDSGPEIRIQSDNYFGRLNLDTGSGILSARRAQYANNLWLDICIMRGKSSNLSLAQEELQTLRQWVKSSGGLLVGESFIKTDNTGAMAL